MTTVTASSRTRHSIEDALCENENTSKVQADLEIAAPFDHFLSRSVTTPKISSYECTHEQTVRESDRCVLILHNSGTTGTFNEMRLDLTFADASERPPTIPPANRYMFGYAACHLFPPDEDMSDRGFSLSSLPLFHVRHLDNGIQKE